MHFENNSISWLSKIKQKTKLYLSKSKSNLGEKKMNSKQL